MLVYQPFLGYLMLKSVIFFASNDMDVWFQVTNNNP